MEAAVNEVVVEAGWKLKMVIRTKRFYTDGELIVLYKTHLLAYIEYRTPAVYHATREILARLDRVQTKFLQDVGIGATEALIQFNLAPLSTRRDIAMLGVIHRSKLGKGPRHFRNFFKRGVSGKLDDPRKSVGGDLVKRSALGLIAVYNLLPEHCTKQKTVREFQKTLQQLVKNRATCGAEDWINTLSPRVPLQRHPLNELPGKLS
jgi:hypothetical protein